MTNRRDSRQRYDAVVVGGGLSGLAAGIELRRLGRSVLMLERRPVAGGLCGTTIVDGYEFVVACNDFGVGLERELRGLGVPAAFQRRSTRFHFEDRVVELPLGWRTSLSLLARGRGGLRAWRSLRLRPEATLLDFARFLESHALRDLVLSLAYPLGIAPARLLLATLGASLSRRYGYGYQRPIAPVGGPAALIAACVGRFEELGGTLRLGSACREIRSEQGRKLVLTDEGPLVAERVLTSEPPAVPPHDADGLAVSTFLVALDRGLAWPEGVHTIAWFPRDVGAWLEQLDAGEEAEAFGFHLFRSDLPARPDHYTVNVCLFLSRGVGEPEPGHLARVEAYVFGQLERLLPGFGRATLYRRFLSPDGFEALHGLSSRPVARLHGPRRPKPPAFDPNSGVHRIGNAVEPPGDHAGQAVLSGILAARHAAQGLRVR